MQTLRSVGVDPDVVAVDSTRHLAFVGDDLPNSTGGFTVYAISTATGRVVSSLQTLRSPALALAVDPSVDELVIDGQTAGGDPSHAGASSFTVVNESTLAVQQTLAVPSQIADLALDPVSGYLFGTNPYGAAPTPQNFSNLLFTFQISAAGVLAPVLNSTGSEGVSLPIAAGEMAIEPAAPGAPATSANLILVNERETQYCSISPNQCNDGLEIYPESLAGAVPTAPVFIPLHVYAFGIAVQPGGAGTSYAWVTDPSDNAVDKVALTPRRTPAGPQYPVTAYPAGNFTEAVAYDTGSGEVFSASFSNVGTVSALLAAGGVHLGNATVGAQPAALGVDTSDHVVVVANSDDDTVSLITEPAQGQTPGPSTSPGGPGTAPVSSSPAQTTQPPVVGSDTTTPAVTSDSPADSSADSSSDSSPTSPQSSGAPGSSPSAESPTASPSATSPSTSSPPGTSSAPSMTSPPFTTGAL